jgi:CubicO group peptidase (beta-lactamase class C family)
MSTDPTADVGATRRALLLGAATFAVAATASPARAQSADEVGAARASAVAAALHAAQPSPALSLAVARPEDVVWAEAFGKADLELEVDATPAHRFKLGSVSKAVTATAAAKLASRGVLDLDAPISTWLPDLPEHHRETTLTQLLTHRGGVRHYIPRDFDAAAPGGSIDVRTYPTNQEILAIFVNDPLVGARGSTVSYSTFGFTLASLAMAAASGEPFPDLIKFEIGAAFDLPSLEEDSILALRPMRARGYNDPAPYRAADPRLPNGWANARLDNPDYKWAGGGLLMTPSDLARFGAALLDAPQSKITGEERGLLFTPLTAPTDDMPPLGLAWRVDNDAKGRLRWHHAGSGPGGRASLVVYPDLGLSIAFASNVMTVPGNVLGPSSDLADAFA